MAKITLIDPPPSIVFGVPFTVTVQHQDLLEPLRFEASPYCEAEWSPQDVMGTGTTDFTVTVKNQMDPCATRKIHVVAESTSARDGWHPEARCS